MMSAKLKMIGSDGSRCVVDFGLEMRDRPSTDWRTLEQVESAYTFSASGEISNDSFGQNLDEMYRLNGDNYFFRRIYKYWKKYHLNDLRAGTQQQTKILKNCESTDYDDRCKFLKEHDLYVDRGYTYGTMWLTQMIPKDVVRQIKKLIIEVRGWS
tara:strand:+ start:34 stop:498 length:465 start_codon:yes stop_codon:yes gene_type:complete